MTKTISKNQRKVLKYLAEIYGHEANCTFFKYIAQETKLSVREVRLACRALARKGLAEWVKGLFDDDGMVAGSGYSATHDGALLVNACSKCKVHLSDMVDGTCQCCWEKENKK